MEFHETSMGRKFFANDFPRLLRELSALNEATRKHNELSESATGPLPCALCRVCADYNDGDFHPSCHDCIAHGWGNFYHKDDPNRPDAPACKAEFL